MRADLLGGRKEGCAARVVAPQHEARRIKRNVVDDGHVDEAVAHVVGRRRGPDVEGASRLRSNPSSRSSSDMMRETFAAGRSAYRAVSLMLPVRTAASRMRQAARSFLSSAMTMSLIWEYP